MNYARFRDDLRAFGYTLSDHGIPADAIDAILSYAEQTGIIAEAKERNDRQYEIQYRQNGSRVMSARLGITQQAANKRFRKIIQKPRKGLMVSASVSA